MSTEITSRVWNKSQHRGTALTVLLAIADQAHSNGVAWPSVETLASMARVGVRAAYTHLERLEQSGELAIYRRQGLHNVYAVTIEQTEAERDSALKMIDDLFEGAKSTPTRAEMITGTPDQMITGIDSATRAEMITGTPDQMITGPVQKDSLPPDQMITRSKDSVVVDIKESLVEDIQQQDRAPDPAERDLFQEHHIPETIWKSWMRHDVVTVVAAILHATQAPGVINPIGLMRAMLEQGTAAPSPEYVQQAQRFWLGVMPYSDEDLEAAGWDPRAVTPGNGHGGAQ